MTSPWNRNEGHFDRPSSGIPVSDARAKAGKPADYVTERLRSAAHQGVIPTGSDTIGQRIDQAIVRLKAAGLGDPKAIYLTESDMLAVRTHTTSGEWKGIRLAIGAASMVYGRHGSRTVLKHVRKGEA